MLFMQSNVLWLVLLNIDQKDETGSQGILCDSFPMGCLLRCRKSSADVSKTQFPVSERTKKTIVTSGPSALIAYSPVEAPVFKIHSVCYPHGEAKRIIIGSIFKS